MVKLNSLFARGEVIGDLRDYRVRDFIYAQLPVVIEVESFLKGKENHPHSGSITVSGTVPACKPLS